MEVKRMKKFESKRNGQIAELVSQTEEQVTMRFEDGEEKSFSPATLKRWWTEIEEPQTDEPEVIEEVEEPIAPEQEEATEEVEEEPAEEIQEEKEEKEEPKEKPKKKGRAKISGNHPLKDYLEGLALERETEVFQATVPSFRSLKVGGRMYMAFTFNKKAVTLWLRSAAVEDLTEYKKMNHMFDARVRFEEDNEENRAKMKELWEASLNFQIERQKKKTK